MNLCTSALAYVYSIGLYNRIVNAVTQSIRMRMNKNNRVGGKR